MMSHGVCVLPHRREPDRPRRAADGLLVCAGHRKGFPGQILDLAAAHEALAAALTSTGTGGERTRRTKSEETGIKISDRVLLVRTLIRDNLAAWSGVVTQGRDVTPPPFRPADMARFLARHTDWICAQDWIPDLWADLLDDPAAEITPERDWRALAQQARTLLQPAGRRRSGLGECPNCGGLLVALIRDTDDLLPGKVWCERCGAQWAPDAWHRLGKRIRAKETA